MRNQRNEWRVLTELIAERAQEYINEADSWDGDVFIWIDGNNANVNLGTDGDSFSGERCPISFFIMDDENGNLTADYDKIDDYASGWFDLRQ